MPSTRTRLEAIARRSMVEHGLRPDFSPEALREAERLTSAAKPDAKVEDLRGLLWCSVDNDDSRDLDQLSVGEDLGGGATRILVAVADVDALVPRGTAIDTHARINTTSVYTPAIIFPMLPEKLSTDLTSLNQDEDRVAVVVEMVVGPDGRLEDSTIRRGVVRNRAKLAYGSLSRWLENEGPPPPALAAVKGLDAQIRLQDQAAQALRTVRHRQGALALRTIEARTVFDGDVIADLVPDEKNRMKEMIEDFMIAANGVSARFLAARGFASVRRVLDIPERWDRIVKLASDLGARLPDSPDARALQKFLVEQARLDPVHFPDVSLSVVKLLGNGSYAVERPGAPGAGHFGLAARDYTHSTAPNRRFPDLITHRLLKAAIAGQPTPYQGGELDSLARHCTEQEDDAQKVERQVRKSAAALLLSSRIGDQFDAIVTGASEKGTWARVLKPPVEGKIERGFRGLDVGDKVRVKLVDTNVERGFIDFVRV
jgi:exoribonuclease-2